MSTDTLFDRIGAEALEAVLRDFYDRVFDDLMIGYLFRDQDKARLIRLEAQLTSRILGAPVPYEGRGMRAAHAKHPIMKGHFMRRNKILEETLADHQVDAAVVAGWMAHAKAAERAILGPRAANATHCIQEPHSQDPPNPDLSIEGS